MFSINYMSVTNMDFIFQLIIVFGFVAVSLAFTAKLVTDAYLEWLQVKTGIQVMTLEKQRRAEQLEEEEDYHD